MLKKILFGALAGLTLFILFLIYNTLTFSSKQITVEPIAQIEISENAVQHFSEAIQIKTISPENIADFDSSEFYRFTTFLADTYPNIEAELEKKVFNEFSFLYKWEGSSADLDPIILMAHLDVVPTIEGNLPDWQVEPFSGLITDTTIWGRGAFDDKTSVVGIMEAVEQLLKTDFTPARTIYISLGHDEEIGGKLGAATIANYLAEEGVQAEFVMDEGGAIAVGLIDGIEKDVAVIGIAEKGFLSLSLTVNIEGGHSSMPAEETAIDVLSRAIVTLKDNPFPPVMSAVSAASYEFLGPEMPFFNKLILANKGVLKSLIFAGASASASSNASIRTTTSPTIFNSGVKDNIIPQTATATVNFRIIPGETIETVIDRVNQTIDDDRISVSGGEFATNPSAVSSTASIGFNLIRKSAMEIYPELLVAPNLVVGATDSRHFESITKDIYRFMPIHINKDNIKTIHGLNERVLISDLKNVIRFYIRLIENSTL